MNKIHLSELEPDTLVTVYVGLIPSQLDGTPPMTATARVFETPQDDGDDPMVWLELDCGPIGKLPQMYLLSEILGLVTRYDLVEVTVQGSTTTAKLRST